MPSLSRAYPADASLDGLEAIRRFCSAKARLFKSMPLRNTPPDGSSRMGGHISAAVRLDESVTATMGVVNFEVFFHDQSESLFRRLCLITGNRAEAEEIMQDAFLKLWERWERVGSMSDPTAYLYRTALNLFRSRYRRAALALRRSVGLVPSVDEFERSDTKSAVMQALKSLAPRQRAALVLTELLGFSSEDAGELLGVQPGTVRTLASQGRIALRRTMEEQE
jgi:RNA polymerase sigma-70 factor, ECF subfamily